MTAWAVCAALLEQISQEERESLLSFLTPATRSLLANSVPADIHGFKEYKELAQELDAIHPSWFAPFLRQLTEKDIRLILPVLKEAQAEELRSILRINNYVPHLKSPAKEFLQSWLWHSVCQSASDLLPRACLPVSAMNTILDCSYPELVRLMEYLGLHDLANDMRRIIDTSKIKQIYACFSAGEIAYLRKLIHAKDPVVFPPLELQSWDGTPQFLKKVVMQRGTNRLAKAVSEEHSSFHWHLIHHLNEEQGLLLKKLCTPLNHPHAVAALKEEALATLDAIRTAETNPKNEK